MKCHKYDKLVVITKGSQFIEADQFSIFHDPIQIIISSECAPASVS